MACTPRNRGPSTPSRLRWAIVVAPRVAWTYSFSSGTSLTCIWTNVSRSAARAQVASISSSEQLKMVRSVYENRSRPLPCQRSYSSSCVSRTRTRSSRSPTGRPSPVSIDDRPKNARTPAAANPRAIPSTWRPPGSSNVVQPLRICSSAHKAADSSASASVNPISYGQIRSWSQVSSPTSSANPRPRCWEVWAWVLTNAGIRIRPGVATVSAAGRGSVPGPPR